MQGMGDYAHNFKRITRVLSWLKSTGEHDNAGDIVAWLQTQDTQQPQGILSGKFKTSLGYWIETVVKDV